MPPSTISQATAFGHDGPLVLSRQAANTPGTRTPVSCCVKRITLLLLNVWADDSADVLLDGVYLYHAQFTQSICAGQAIGCRPGDLGVINTPLTAGNHTLAFVLYQVGTGTDTFSNPFGLLFTGTAPADPPIGILIATPEPSSIVLLGTLGLIGAILLKRRGRWGRTGVFVAGR